MKSVAGRLKLDLAQFRAMEAFAMFASDLDPASRAQLARGARLVELLKQRRAAPYPVEEQVVSIWTGTTGKLDDIAVEDVRPSRRSCSTPCVATARSSRRSARREARRGHRGGPRARSSTT